MKNFLFKFLDHAAGITGYIILYGIIYPVDWVFRKVFGRREIKLDESEKYYHL